MEKKTVGTTAVVIFGAILVISALSGNNMERGELAQVQGAMRNLKRVDNLQMTYIYSFSQGEITGTDEVDVWADMLTGSWVSEYYTTDEDGTRLYLKQFCDGREVYNYIEWNGEWAAAQNIDGNDVPKLENITVLTYDGNDILEAESETMDGGQKISYSFTPEYLEGEREKRIAEIETAYSSYQKSGVSEEELDSVRLTVEQYKQTRYEDMIVAYTVDANQVLRGMECTATLIMPELLQDENGQTDLGGEQEMEILLRIDVERYNQEGIQNKIEQCRNEIMY